jgi:hypothetical protein
VAAGGYLGWVVGVGTDPDWADPLGGFVLLIRAAVAAVVGAVVGAIFGAVVGAVLGSLGGSWVSRKAAPPEDPQTPRPGDPRYGYDDWNEKQAP